MANKKISKGGKTKTAKKNGAKVAKRGKPSNSPKKTLKKTAAKKAAVKKVAAKKSAKKKIATKKVRPSKKTLQAARVTSTKKSQAAKPVKKTTTSKVKVSSVPKTVKSPQSSMRVAPLDDRIFVRMAPLSDLVTPAGLILMESAAQESSYCKGQVIAVGHGHRDKKGRVRPVEVQVGDQILFQKYSGERLDIEGVTHFILRESEVVGILKD